MELEENSGYNILHRYLLNSSFLISSKKCTGIFILWISFSKIKEDGDFIISLTLGVGILTNV
jgi:hypothetical protein